MIGKKGHLNEHRFYMTYICFNMSKRGMYPKDRCKIQPLVATTFQLIAIILCNLIIIS